MQNTKDPKIISEKSLSKIEYDARFIEKIPVNERTVDFIIYAIGKNPLVTRFLTEEELLNQQIAFYIGLTVKDHKHLIKENLLNEEFYEEYFIQKLKTNKLDDSETFINKEYLSSESKIKEIISKYGTFKMKHIHDDLKDNENVVYYFCEQNKSNQIWASDRIKSLANETGVEVHKYLKAKILYESMDAKFDNKTNQKQIKI